MREGYGFYWPPGKVPFLVKPDLDYRIPSPPKGAIKAEVRHDVPYLREKPSRLVAMPAAKVNTNAAVPQREGAEAADAENDAPAEQQPAPEVEPVCEDSDPLTSRGAYVVVITLQYVILQMHHPLEFHWISSHSF